MSTMSFQSYVRERMLKRREAALRDEASEALAAFAPRRPRPFKPRSRPRQYKPAQAAPAVAAKVVVAAAAAPSFATNPVPRAPATPTPALNVAQIDPALFNPMPERIVTREVPRPATPSLADALPGVGFPVAGARPGGCARRPGRDPA